MTHLTDELRRVVGPAGVVEDQIALLTYDADASMIDSRCPDLVVLPDSDDPARQIAAVVQLAAKAGLPVVPRGAGTGISGGAIAWQGGIVVSTARMDAVEQIAVENRWAMVQSGVVNLELSQRLAPLGYQFAPDPSSQRACTVGGNIANNAGGPHCLKYGVTTNHILAVEIVLHDGTILWTGDGVEAAAGYDLTGLVVGSEGTFGVVTRALVRLTRLAEQTRVVLALFPSIIAASEAVSAIVAAGYLPTSLEVMDRNAIRAVNTGYGLGLPDVAAALIVEVDGVADGLDASLSEIGAVCRAKGALELRPASTPAEQARVWLARKAVAGAIGRLAPAYYLVDTVVPRTRLPLMMEHVERLSQEYQLDVVNVFHAGDGNLHPLVLYDKHDPDQLRRAQAIGVAVLHLSIAQGGVISGEHGIGLEKQKYLPLLFGEADLEAMASIYAIFNPQERFNPAKIFPTDVRPLELARRQRERLTIDARHETRDTRRETLAADLVEIVGDQHVLQGDAANRYCISGLQPHLVVFPADIEQLSVVMAACHRAGAVVVPWGGGTQQTLGRLTYKPDVVIVTQRLNHVITYEPDDLTIGVGAGMTLGALDTLLARHGQMLPLDVPGAQEATIGGLVATGATGPRRLRYGTLRDWLLAVTVVEVDGTVIKSGAQVVKNVSGYDLVKLFHQSYGTLGIIAAVSLKTLPRPRSETTLLLGFARRADALALLPHIAATALTPAAVEYLEIDHQMTDHDPDAPLVPRSPALAVRIEGSQAVTMRHLRDLSALAATHDANQINVLQGAGHAALWAQVAALHDPAAISENTLLLRLAVPPAELGAALAHLQQLCAAYSLDCWWTAHALNGVVLAHFSGSSEQFGQIQRALSERWRHSHVLAGALNLQDISLWGAQPAGIDLMRAIKAAFDPHNRLNPGRYVV